MGQLLPIYGLYRGHVRETGLNHLLETRTLAGTEIPDLDQVADAAVDPAAR